MSYMYLHFAEYFYNHVLNRLSLFRAYLIFESIKTYFERIMHIFIISPYLLNLYYQCAKAHKKELAKFYITIKCIIKLYLSLCMRKPTIWVPTRSDKKRAVQSQKMVGWRLEILDLESRGIVLSE